MKKIFLLVLMPVLFVPVVLAQTQTASVSATPAVTESVGEREVLNIKEKIASQVAELNKNKKAVAGVITSIDTDSLKIKNGENKEYLIKTDSDLTKILQISDNREIKLSDLKKNAYIIVSGIILDNVINANYIYLDKQTIIRSGKITQIDKDNYVFKIMTADRDQVNLTIENSTKQQIMNIKSLDIERVGFSKIKEGDTIHFLGDQSDNGNLTALRYLIIPQEYFIK